MIKSIFRLGLIFLFTTTEAWALVNTSSLKLSAYGGWQILNIDPSSFTLIGGEVVRLAPDRQLNNSFTPGVGIAYQFVTQENQALFGFLHDVSIGLDIFYFSTSQWGDALDFKILNDFNYRLYVQSLRYMANIELTFGSNDMWIFPFIEVGAGLAANSASYAQTPNATNPFGTNLNIARRTNNQFAYDVGAGFKVAVNNNVQLSLRYLYSDLGSATTSKHANLIVTSPINVPLRPQVWMVGITYLA